jgi:hypothetical protein
MKFDNFSVNPAPGGFMPGGFIEGAGVDEVGKF